MWFALCNWLMSCCRKIKGLGHKKEHNSSDTPSAGFELSSRLEEGTLPSAPAPRAVVADESGSLHVGRVGAPGTDWATS